MCDTDINKWGKGWLDFTTYKEDLAGGSNTEKISMTPYQTAEARKQHSTCIYFEISAVHPLTNFISLYTIMPTIISTFMAAGKNKKI